MKLRSRAAVAVIVATWLALALALAAVALSPPVSAHEDDQEGGPPVYLVHGMPDAVFEVRMGDDRRLKGLRFGQFHNLRAFAGTTMSFSFEILDSGEPVVATDGFTVPDDRSLSLVVHHDIDGSGDLTAFENPLDPLDAGMSRLVVRHLAAAGPLDVLVDGETTLSGIEHGWAEAIELPAGAVSVSLVPTGGDSGVEAAPIEPVDVELTAGDRIIVYGFGSADDETMALVTDIVHGIDSGADDGLPLRAMAATTALAVVIGVIGFGRIRRRVHRG